VTDQLKLTAPVSKPLHHVPCHISPSGSYIFDSLDFIYQSHTQWSPLTSRIDVREVTLCGVWPLMRTVQSNNTEQVEDGLGKTVPNTELIVLDIW